MSRTARDPFVLCAGLRTPHECPTVGLLPSECALRARMPSEARADGESWRPSVRHCCYRDWICEHRSFLILGLDSRGLHLKSYVSHPVQ